MIETDMRAASTFALNLVLMVMSHEVIAQNISDLPPNSAPFDFTAQQIKELDNRYEGIKGSCMLFDDFMPGKMVLKRGKAYENVMLNYDAYADELIAKEPKLNEAVIIRKDMVESFTLESPDGEIKFIRSTVNGTPIYLLRLVSDSITLHVKAGKTIKKANIGGAYNTSEMRSDEFVPDNVYYVSKQGSPLAKIENTKRGIVKAFPEYEAQLSSYLKKKRIDFNDFMEVKLIIMYLNTL